MSIVSRLVKCTGSVAVISPSGEIRRGSVEILGKALDLVLNTEHANAAEIDCIVISFSKVTALLSQGIQTLVTLHDRTVDAGKAFHITDLPKTVRYTLKITNLLEFLGEAENLSIILSERQLSEDDLGPLERS